MRRGFDKKERSGGCVLAVVLVIAAIYYAPHPDTPKTTFAPAAAQSVTPASNTAARDAARAEWVKHGLPPALMASMNRALTRNPSLGEAGSALNNRFVETYDQLRRQHDVILTDIHWPELLAAECAVALPPPATTPLPDTPSPGPLKSMFTEDTPEPVVAPTYTPYTAAPPYASPWESKSVHVDGYYRKDGKYVQPYNRRP